MANAKHDQNRVPTLIAVSSVDGITPVQIYGDPTTHRLLVDLTGVGTGDVIGPSSATDNAIARFDSTTGKLIQNSGITISDASGGTNLITIQAIGELRIASGSTEDINFYTDAGVGGQQVGSISGTDGSFNWGYDPATGFKVDYLGNIRHIASLDYNWPNSDPSVNGVIKRDAIGNITLDALDLSTDYVTGVLGVANGGTGATTLADANIVTNSGTSTDNAIVRFDSTTGKIIQDNTQWTIDDNGKMTGTISTEEGLSLTSSLGAGAGNNLVLLQTTNSSWDRPMLRIIDNTTNGGAANIRIDSPNPDIELVESDQTTPAGKFEIAVQGDKFQINGRNAADNSFEQILNISRVASGGMMGLGVANGDTPNGMLEIVKTSGKHYLLASTAVGANSGNIAGITENGVLSVGGWIDGTTATGKIQLNSNATSPSSIDLTNTITVGTGTGGANATNKYLGQFGWVSRDSSFTNPKLVAYIGAEATETYAADTDTGSDMVFYTGTDDGTSPVERMRLKSGALVPGSNDLIALGNTSLMFSDLFLASGGVVNFNNGDVTITHSTDALTIGGGKQIFAATTTSYASFNIPTGTAPTSPVDGDVWREDNTNTGLKIRINGVTKTITVS